jgi:hypothetical protein
MIYPLKKSFCSNIPKDLLTVWIFVIIAIMKNPNVLNNIMNRDTYVTGKCAVILSDILRKDFEKIYHNTREEKINMFVRQTLDSLHKKVQTHLSMNSMEDLTVLDLNNFEEFAPQEDYFFYKIDGMDNFRRGINNFSVTTGILSQGKLFCINVYIPHHDSMMWYQENDNQVYVNNAIVWANNFTKRTQRPKDLIALDITGPYSLDTEKNYMMNNNCFYHWFLLMNDSVDQWHWDTPMDQPTTLIFNEFMGFNAMAMEKKENIYYINKTYYKPIN